MTMKTATVKSYFLSEDDIKQAILDYVFKNDPYTDVIGYDVSCTQSWNFTVVADIREAKCKQK